MKKTNVRDNETDARFDKYFGLRLIRKTASIYIFGALLLVACQQPSGTQPRSSVAPSPTPTVGDEKTEVTQSDSSTGVAIKVVRNSDPGIPLKDRLNKYDLIVNIPSNLFSRGLTAKYTLDGGAIHPDKYKNINLDLSKSVSDTHYQYKETFSIFNERLLPRYVEVRIYQDEKILGKPFLSQALLPDLLIPRRVKEQVVPSELALKYEDLCKADKDKYKDSRDSFPVNTPKCVQVTQRTLLRDAGGDFHPPAKGLYLDTLYFEEGSILAIKSASLAIHAQTIVSENASIETFSEAEAAQPAPAEQPGLHGGRIELMSSALKGLLKIYLRGTKGGAGKNGENAPPPGGDLKGADGTPLTLSGNPKHAENGKQGYQGQDGHPGMPGGDTGSAFVSVGIAEIPPQITYHPGEGGVGGKGGKGGAGGAGGRIKTGEKFIPGQKDWVGIYNDNSREKNRDCGTGRFHTNCRINVSCVANGKQHTYECDSLLNQKTKEWYSHPDTKNKQSPYFLPKAGVQGPHGRDGSPGQKGPMGKMETGHL